jgi:hypothetical protein
MRIIVMPTTRAIPMKLFHILFLCLLATPTFCQNKVSELAQRFLSSLDAEQSKKVQYAFNDNERFNWHFVPKSRNGISLHELKGEQQDHLFSLLRASLSEQGYSKVRGIINLENVLREVEGRSSTDTYRDPLNYYFTLFGVPDDKRAWGWRFEGHHIAFNFTSIKGLIESSTPSFLGSNPGIVRSGPERGKEVLKKETDLGFALVRSLSKQQLQTAWLSKEALPEILSFNSRKAESLTPIGISFQSLEASQKKIFLELLQVYISNYELGFANRLEAKIRKAGIQNLSFGWAGSLEPGVGHYYRIQGPMLLIEYDNTQNSGNHVHTVVRDLTNDFGEDILREHYQKEHGK